MDEVAEGKAVVGVELRRSEDMARGCLARLPRDGLIDGGSSRMTVLGRRSDYPPRSRWMNGRM